MREDDYCMAEFRGTGLLLDAVSWEMEARQEDGQGSVALQFDFAGFEASLSFDIETAEQFLIEFRDEIVRAKQQELEWETDTDPDTGIAEGEA